MIKIQHYSNQFSNKKTIHSLCQDFGVSNVDLTSWRPDISIVHAQANAASGKRLIYDFPDGKDNGEYIQTFIRQKGLDITEIETAEKRITQIIEDKKASDKEKAEAENVKKQTLKDLSDAIKGDTTQSSETTQPSNA